MILPAPVAVVIAGSEYTIPPRTAAEWHDALADPHGIAVPLLAAEDRIAVMRDVAMGRAERDECAAAGMRALADATGRRAPAAFRLLSGGMGGGMLTGMMVVHGIDPRVWGVGGWCDAAYVLMVRNRDDSARTKIDLELDLPLPGQDPDDDDGWDMVVM